MDRPQGRAVFYGLAQPELVDVLRFVEALFAATSIRIAPWPTHGVSG